MFVLHSYMHQERVLARLQEEVNKLYKDGVLHKPASASSALLTRTINKLLRESPLAMPARTLHVLIPFLKEKDTITFNDVSELLNAHGINDSIQHHKWLQFIEEVFVYINHTNRY
ncbi:hypothetical protein [Vibrio hepatarius]|uniref:Uncharacterized protein n=1 Tax=Vibrio hepatarius TaxID=171383 RepID=A0A0M0I4W8_9VIBR|nr:hypothetical protein [Vibrio hepatarius]KOO09162.1 hypothetical protein AKJ31_02030 [Vibrio hepatarius]